MARGRFVTGSAGWSYKDWVGPFYPVGSKAGDYLAHYSQHFNGVEIDSTFYGIPRHTTVQGWDRATPDGFLFSPKMVRDVTHENFLVDCDAIVSEYLSALELLGDKLGTIILQFPYYKKASGVTLPLFLEKLCPFLDELPKPFRFGVEIRNKAFLKEDLLSALRDRGVALVLIDHVWMPPPKHYVAKLESFLTAEFLPIRLIGDRYGIEALTDTFDEVILDKTSRSRSWARLVQQALDKVFEVTTFVNNHYSGYSPDEARTLTRLVEDLGEASEA